MNESLFEGRSVKQVDLPITSLTFIPRKNNSPLISYGGKNFSKICL